MTPEEKIVALNKRTSVDIEVLRQLPEENLSHYYNRTSTLSSKGMGALHAGLAGVMAVLGVLEAATGNYGWAFIDAGLGALNGAFAYGNYTGAADNAAVGQEIQREVLRPRAPENPEDNGPVNGPLPS